MKKVIFALLIAAGSFIGTTQAQCVKTGTVIIDGFYGYPDFYGMIAKSALTEEDVDINLGSLGPLGAKVEYMFTDKIGLGGAFYYAKTSADWKSTSAFDWEASIARIRLMATFNLHFGTSDTFDPYFMIGTGYASSTATIKTNDPGELAEESVNITLVPVAFRTGIGARFFFTENLGANIELGLGSGAMLQAGISAKF